MNDLINEILSLTNHNGVEILSPNLFDERTVRAKVNEFGYKLFILEGLQITTREDLFRALADALHFPSYFGYNWNAVDECLMDMEWLPAKGYIILFNNPERFIRNCPSDYKILLEVVNWVSTAWASQQIRFLLILAKDIAE